MRRVVVDKLCMSSGTDGSTSVDTCYGEEAFFLYKGGNFDQNRREFMG
jgi:hypothetical protein